MFELYILKECPYCKKVMKFCDENHINCKKNYIEDKNNEDKLIKIGGKRQVPFLIDTDRNIQMYESNDIIEYFKTIK